MTQSYFGSDKLYLRVLWASGFKEFDSAAALTMVVAICYEKMIEQVEQTDSS